MYFLREQFFKRAFWKTSNEEYFFFNKRFITFVCNLYSEKDSLNIREVNSKTGNFFK